MILINCERSGIVRRAFEELGHTDVWSCDLEPADDGGRHLQMDAIEALTVKPWQLMIAHPPCTYLCNSGVRWFSSDTTGRRWDVLLPEARDFFMALWNADIPRICIENPTPHKYARLPRYTQAIHPYHFGDNASKRTCLWLKGLPLLVSDPRQHHPPKIINGKKRWANQAPSGADKTSPGPERSRIRSQTYKGFAQAMAEQWLPVHLGKE